MHPMTTIRRLMLGGLAAFVGGPAIAQPPSAAPPNAAIQPAVKPPEIKLSERGELMVPVGGVVRFKPSLPSPFTDVTTSNSLIVRTDRDDDPNYVRLIGLVPGTAKLTFTLADGRKGSFDILVAPDFEYMQRVIARAVPTASIQLIPGTGNNIIVSGYVNKPEDADLVMRIVQSSVVTSTTSTQYSNTNVSATSAQPAADPNNPQPPGSTGAANTGGAGASSNTGVISSQTTVGTIINAIQVGGLQHVQIEVVFASVNRTKIRQRGAAFRINGTQGSLLSEMLNGAPNLTASIAPAGIFIALNALKGENLAKLLSEPKVVTQSGRPATIFSGGQQATLGQTGGSQQGSSVQLVPVGTTMSVLPIVYGNGKIYLEINPRNVQVDFARGIAVASNGGGGVTNTPGFTEQSVQASVMLESGQTYAIGGLLESQTQMTANKIPVIGEIPYVGPLFSNNRAEERETELIILVTPRLVDALDCNQVPKRVPGRETRSIDDYEFFLEGLLEAPRGQRQVWNGRCYNAAWKCDPLGAFPCKGNVCGGNNGGCNTPTCLPSTTPAPVTPAITPATPMIPATPVAQPTAAPAVEPIVMPQVAPNATPVEPPAEPVALPVLPETTATPGPVAPIDVPAPAPVLPPGDEK